MRSLRLWALGVAASAMIASGAVMAQGAAASYPSKPVTIILAIAAGGPSDGETRLFAAKMSELLGQPFVVEYKPGAGSTIGSSYVAKAAPDGYTLLVPQGAFSSFPALYKSLPFDTIKDFAPVSLMVRRASVLVSSLSFPAKTFAEYLAYARANPGKINYATTGAGGTGHLAGAWLHNLTKSKVTFIHYKGIPQILTDLVPGRVDVSPFALPPALPLIKDGKLRAIAFMNNERTPLLPDVPTIGEKDIPGYDYKSWLGFSAPAGTPPAIINKLSEAFAKVARMPDVVANLAAQGSVSVGSTPEQFKQLIIDETAQWQKVIQESGIQLEQ